MTEENAIALTEQLIRLGLGDRAGELFMNLNNPEKDFFIVWGSQIDNDLLQYFLRFERNAADLIFTIEAKLLPTPKGNSKNLRDEHEYVYGEGAGIQRFKDGNHGRDNLDNILPENAMIGFLKENDFDFWLQKINQWVRDANWVESEILEKIYFKSTGKLKSKHRRSDKSDLLLHHFWIKVA
jgi:hypothetical protein